VGHRQADAGLTRSGTADESDHRREQEGAVRVVPGEAMLRTAARTFCEGRKKRGCVGRGQPLSLGRDEVAGQDTDVGRV
jgi:hypothetical protein